MSSILLEEPFSTKRATYADYKALEVDDNFWYELINGELVKKSAPAPRHQMIQANLFWSFSSHVRQYSLGVLLCAPVDVFVDEYSVPQPDLLFIAKERQHIITDDGVMGAPNLVVEILSPSSVKRDRSDKMRLYQRLQVPEYWIIDPKSATVEIYHFVDGAYDLVSFAVERGNVDSTQLAGFSLEVSTIF